MRERGKTSVVDLLSYLKREREREIENCLFSHTKRQKRIGMPAFIESSVQKREETCGRRNESQIFATQRISANIHFPLLLKLAKYVEFSIF